MTEQATSTPTPAPRPPRRWRKRKWCLIIVAAGLLCWWWFNRSPTITLPDGEIVVVERVTYGKMHVSQPPGLARLAHRFLDYPVGQTDIVSQSETIGVWLECHSRWLRQPRNFQEVYTVILIDRNGWPHWSGFFTEDERTTNGSHVQSGQSVDLRSLRPGSEIVSIAVFQPVRPDAHPLTLGLVDGDGKILGTTEISNPAPIPPESNWTPDELPATRTDGDLSVTLNAVRFLPPPPPRDGAPHVPDLVRGIRVIPEFEVRWKDQPCDDCCLQTDDDYRGALFEPLLERARLDDHSGCNLSPFEPAWEWRHHFYPGPTGEFDPEDVWDAGTVRFPSAGEVDADSRTGEIHDLEYGILSVHGPGEHTMTVELGRRINRHGGSMDAGYRFDVRRVPQGSTTGVYDVVSDVPFLLVTSPAILKDGHQYLTPRFHLVLRDSQGSVVPSTIEMLSCVQDTDNMPDGVDHPCEYWLAFPEKKHRDLASASVTFSQYRIREFSFYIRPPSLDLYREFGCLPSTVRSAE